MRRNSGFTAYEVAVTMAIVAVLASITMPPFLKWLNGHRLGGAAINLMSDLERSKVKAIRESSDVTIQLAADRYVCFLDNGAGGGTAGNQIQEAGEPTIEVRYLPAGVHINLADLTVPNQRFRFNSRGQAQDLALAERIVLVNKTGSRVVRVNRLGNIRIQ